MFRDSSKFIVVDLEATCWENDLPPEGETTEIIQIGFCYLDIASLEVVDKGSILIKPELGKISEFCTQLTGITPKMARSGMTFDSACKNLIRKYGTRRFAWGSWGCTDLDGIKRDCITKNTEYPFCEQYIDIQALYTFAFNAPVRIGLEKALAESGLGFEGTPHKGDDDAWNTARIFRKILAVNRV